MCFIKMLKNMFAQRNRSCRLKQIQVRGEISLKIIFNIYLPFIIFIFRAIYFKIMQKEPHSQEKVVQQTEHTQFKMTADQIFTNIDPSDNNHNGQYLTLKKDHSFDLTSSNSSWASDSISWNWDSFFYIDGTWSYDKGTKIITLTANKFKAKLQDPIQNQQEVLDKGFPNRVVSTSNFDESSKEIKAFVVWWEYSKFSRVGQGLLKRK